MPKLRSVDITAEDTQHCLKELNEKLEEIGITKDNIISIEREARMTNKKYQVTLFVFYWSE